MAIAESVLLTDFKMPIIFSGKSLIFIIGLTTAILILEQRYKKRNLNPTYEL